MQIPLGASNCRNQDMESIIIDDTVSKIENCSFKGDNELRSVYIPCSVTEIGDGAFAGCNALESISIPNSVVRIGYGAFARCKNLRNVTICPHGFSNQQGVIASTAFDCCENLESVIVPDTVNIIGDDAFKGCVRLKSFVTYPLDKTAVKSYGWLGQLAFIRCDSLQVVVLPDSISRIDAACFVGCKSLKSIKLPNDLLTVGESAFQGCGKLEAIELPDSVYLVEKDAFRKCPSLKTIKCSNPDVLKDARLRKGIKII